jgi:polysaccharide pyruvyl transferase WcaK-like protein
MDALIVGWTGHGNLGDEAYRLAFPLVLPGHDLRFADRIRPGDRPDLLVLGGGDICREGFTRGFTPEQNAHAVAASISVTSTSDFAFLRACRRVVVRDEASRLLCVEQGVGGAELVPDFAFALDADPGRGRTWLAEAFAAAGRDLYEKVVCVAPNSYTIFGGHEFKARDFQKAVVVADDLAWLADRTPASFLFLPFSTHCPADDRTPCSYVQSKAKYHRKNLVVYGGVDVRTALDIMAACDVVVGARLHSLIFAAIGGVPFIALDHHRKIRDFVDTIGKNSWAFDFYGHDRNAILKLLREHLAGGPSADLQMFSSQARSAILSLNLSS